jgi:hypothetical protein
VLSSACRDFQPLPATAQCLSRGRCKTPEGAGLLQAVVISASNQFR